MQKSPQFSPKMPVAEKPFFKELLAQPAAPVERLMAIILGGSALAVGAYLTSAPVFLASVGVSFVLRGLYTSINYVTRRGHVDGISGKHAAAELTGLAINTVIASTLAFSPLFNVKYAAQKDMDDFVMHGIEMTKEGKVGRVFATFPSVAPFDPLQREIRRGYSFQRDEQGCTLTVGTKTTGVTHYVVKDEGAQGVFLVAPNGAVRKVGNRLQNNNVFPPAGLKSGS